MHWSDIIGHEENIRLLQQAIAVGKTPHAWLFHGPEGIGKGMVARVFAQALLCGGEGDRPCGLCFSCRQLDAGTHPDLLWVKAEGAAVKIEQIRSLQREASLAAYDGGYRVCILEDAEKMTVQAANSLLKILEEPDGHLIFVLIASSRHSLLETIISRCRGLTFYPLPYDRLTGELVRRGISEAKAQTAARLSSGRMGLAFSLVEPEGLELRNQAARLLEQLREKKEIWDTAAAWEKLDRKEVVSLLDFMSSLLRDLIVLKYRQENTLLYHFDLADGLGSQASGWTEEALVQGLKKIREARIALMGNANVRLTGEALLIELGQLAGEV